jgi:TonB-linked SusC/RagA family outer membrane protein
MMKTFTKFISRKGQIFRFSLLTLFLCVSSVLLAQEQIIVGKVLDEDGSGLPGATIIEKGTSNGTTTDLDGNYRLAVPNNSTLIYSFVGYETAEFPVGNRTTIDVSMELDVRALAEIVVVGYGTVEKGDVTGVVNKVSSENFNKGVITSPDQLLAGKVAGVSIIPNSGEPGGQVSIKMRGGTSISLSNEPLFVIDGVPLDNTPFNPGGFSQGRNPLNFINPSDVESITVLKDASAAAIYGSRGANGVIIITTKTGGNSDKPKVTYDGSIGISSFVDEVDIFTADEFRQVVRVYGSRNEDKLGDANTDWLSEIVQGAKTTTHNVSVSGGLEKGGYRLSLGYQELEGVLLYSKTKRTSLNYSMNKSLLNDAIQVKFHTKNAFTDDVFSSNQVGSALSFDPTQPIYDTASIYGGYFEYNNTLAGRNPVA